MDCVKFIALDKDDLEVVSTHLQDAEVKVADVHWRPQEKRLVLGVARFDWMAAGVVMLTFSGGATLRLEVECLEVELADLGPTWASADRPAHWDDVIDARG